AGPDVPPVEIDLIERPHREGDGTQGDIRAAIAQRAPNTNFVVHSQRGADLCAPLGGIDAVVVIVEAIVVDDAPVQPHRTAAEYAGRGEHLAVVTRAVDEMQRTQGRTAVVESHSELNADAGLFENRQSPVRGEAIAEVRIDAKVGRFFVAIEPREQRKIVEIRTRRLYVECVL